MANTHEGVVVIGKSHGGNSHSTVNIAYGNLNYGQFEHPNLLSLMHVLLIMTQVPDRKKISYGQTFSACQSNLVSLTCYWITVTLLQFPFLKRLINSLKSCRFH